MKNTKLKSAHFTSPQEPTVTFERYLVENQKDLKDFFEAFPQNKKFMNDSLTKSLSEGYIILLTEVTMSGFNSYCFETVVTDETDLTKLHPSSFIRVKIGTEMKDEVEKMLITFWSRIGIDIPNNFEDIVQFCYEDVLETADPINWHDGDVAIAFRRWIEAQSPESEN